MKKTYAAASIYGIADRMDAADIQRWLGWHKRLKYPPRFINLFTAARFEQGPNLLRQIRDSLPMTTPVWRGYDGKDAWGNLPPPKNEWDDSNFYLRCWNHSMMSPQMAAGLWFARRVKPHLAVIRETGAAVMLLNEAQPVFNALYEAECIRVLGEEGVRASAFRWATGTPDWGDYTAEAIHKAVEMAEKYNAIIGPHEYAGVTPPLQNSLINRYTSLLKLFKTAPDVFIGEFGLAVAALVNGAIKIDADGGWQEIPVDEGQYFTFIKDTAKVWYLPNKVSFSIYDWAGWGRNNSFGVANSQGLLDRLVEASEWMTFDVEDDAVLPQAPFVMERPPEATIGIRARVKSLPGGVRNLRARWNYAAPKSGELKPGDLVRRFDMPIRDGLVNATTGGKWIFVEVLTGETVTASGWTWRDNIVWESATATQEIPVIVVQPDLPPPPPETIDDIEPLPAPTTPPPPMPVVKRYSFEITATEPRHDAIEASIMALMQSVALFGQALAGVPITLRTEPVVST